MDRLLSKVGSSSSCCCSGGWDGHGHGWPVPVNCMSASAGFACAQHVLRAQAVRRNPSASGHVLLVAHEQTQAHACFACRQRCCCARAACCWAARWVRPAHGSGRPPTRRETSAGRPLPAGALALACAADEPPACPKHISVLAQSIASPSLLPLLLPRKLGTLGPGAMFLPLPPEHTRACTHACPARINTRRLHSVESLREALEAAGFTDVDVAPTTWRVREFGGL